MRTRRILARAPSNIAIVKYMGKRDAARNLPENSSLSLTLSQLCTFVEVREVAIGQAGVGARFVAERPEGAKGEAPVLGADGTEKFLRHFSRVSERMPTVLSAHALEVRDAAPAGVEIRSANTFPAAAGIASSASSFAALTLASAAASARDPTLFRARYAEDPALRRDLAALSREGSGSSCRSFEGPFVAWEGERAERIPSALVPLSDLIVVVSARAKAVGSGEAHRRVKSSPQWPERPARAENRFQALKKALPRGDFSALIELAVADFQEMHRLFETSVPPFSYYEPGTAEVLDFLAAESGVAFTMDAGANVHALVPQAEEEFWRRKLSARFPQFPILVDREGTGAEFVVLEENP